MSSGENVVFDTPFFEKHRRNNFEFGNVRKEDPLVSIYQLLPKKVIASSETEGIVLRQYWIGEHEVKLKIGPAFILLEDGPCNGQTDTQTGLMYPGDREDDVENALGALAIRQMLNTGKLSDHVQFEVKELRDFLTERLNVTYTAKEIYEALDIMTGSQLVLESELIGLPQGYRLYETRLCGIQVEEEFGINRYETRFHSSFLRNLSLGQFFIDSLEWQYELESSLARYLYSLLSFKCRFSSGRFVYDIEARKTLENTSDGFDETNPCLGWEALHEALDELMSIQVIKVWRSEDIKTDSLCESKKDLKTDERITIEISDRFLEFHKDLLQDQ